jgi:hypothetical protein
MTETIQSFIIWKHGFNKLQEIMTIIRDHPNIIINRIYKRKVNIKQFIDHIYSLDTASRDHIEEKSRYLYNLPNEIYVIFVTDTNTQNVIKPGTNHVYSLHETMIKWHARMLFNPRNSEFIDPLPEINEEMIHNASIQKAWIKGITHEHVIHSSDNENEAKLIARFFRFGVEDVNIYYPAESHVLREVDISDICVNIVNEPLINIKQTPHYRYLLGEKEAYNNYIMAFTGTIITCDNFSEAYDKLINIFDYRKEFYINCIFDESINKHVVQNGVHRLAILVNMGVTKVNIYSTK